jgi:hypothetical protein
MGDSGPTGGVTVLGPGDGFDEEEIFSLAATEAGLIDQINDDNEH